MRGAHADLAASVQLYDSAGGVESLAPEPRREYLPDFAEGRRLGRLDDQPVEGSVVECPTDRRAAGQLASQPGKRAERCGGMLTQALALGVIAATRGFSPWAAGAALLGVGTAMVYPTLLAAIGDVAHPQWRASAVGVYRLWRDGGFAIGALLAGIVADALGLTAAIWVVAGLTAASGVLVAVRMYETHPRQPRHPTPTPGTTPRDPGTDTQR